MEFYINKNATLPILKMALIQDGRNDYMSFYEKIQNANIYFTLTNVVTGIKRIAKKVVGTQLVVPQNDNSNDEYYITYQFTQKETSIAGRYIGQFEIEFLDGSGTLLMPIKEQLYVNILEGDILV